MVAKNDAASSTRAFMTSRVFDAPRELVWKALTEPERLKRWWGPKGFTVKSAEVDLSPGRSFLYCLQGPGGGFEMWGKWIYREIVAPEKLVAVTSFADEKSNTVPNPMAPTWPMELVGTMTLSEHDGKTTLACSMSAEGATDAERERFEAGFDGMEEGFTGTLDKLADYLARA